MKIIGAKVKEVRYKISLDGVVLYVDAKFESSKNMISDITILNLDGEVVNLGQGAEHTIYDFISQNFYSHEDVWENI